MILLEHIVRDVRHAVRSIARMPLLAAVIVVSLGRSASASTPSSSPGSRRWCSSRSPASQGSAAFHSVEPRTETGLLSRGVVARVPTTCASGCIVSRTCSRSGCVPLYVGEAGAVERASGLLVSDNYFPALGLQPAAGGFSGRRSRPPGGDPVVVISYGYWQTALRRRSPDVLGQTIRVNGSRSDDRRRHAARIPGHDDRAERSTSGCRRRSPRCCSRGSRELEDRGIRGYTVHRDARGRRHAARRRRPISTAMRQLARAYPATNATLAGEVLPFSERRAARSGC